MMNRAWMRLRVLALALFVSGEVGCGTRPPEPTNPPITWQVLSVGPAVGAGPPAEPGTPISPVVVVLSGPPGFLRATLVIEEGPPNSATNQALYDVLFPVRGSVRFEASVPSSPDRRGPARVQFRRDSDSEASVAVVEPDIPFLAESAKVTTEPILGPNRSIREGDETVVGRWVVGTGRKVMTATVRVLLSRRPTEPRMKREARPLLPQPKSAADQPGDLR